MLASGQCKNFVQTTTHKDIALQDSKQKKYERAKRMFRVNIHLVNQMYEDMSTFVAYNIVTLRGLKTLSAEFRGWN